MSANLTVARAKGIVVKVRTRISRVAIYIAGGGFTWDAVVIMGGGDYEKRFTALRYDGTDLPAATADRLLAALLLGYAVGKVKVEDDEVYVGYYAPRAVEATIYYFKNADRTFLVRCGAVYDLGERSEAEHSARYAFDEPEVLKVVEEFLRALP